MQNTPQTFRGAPAPGVNFADHSYDNHIGVHCQPSGYQPYPNQPYHPLPSPRPHHYANHQMQQNMPYRHPGGAYAPNQNQYGSNINQDIYRNHSGYAGGNNRNMSSKPWTETNSSAEMMPPYSQVSHSQMMNNPPPQMPVSTMRSPPHATSNINPAPPQGQQHYRQMQSPAHSPHSWSQAQIPSPGVMHSSRTTPSPLPTHVRSPGHSQPFSPPTAHAMNIQPHPQPPENGQMPQPVNSAGGNDSQNPNNPLHSLQKMVMLDQDSKAMIPMMSDGNDQYTNHCGSHNYVPEECVNNESKDSVYSTYYNMDENRFESKPSGSGNNSYPNVQQVSNCNFPVPSHLINSDEVQSNQIVPNSSSNVSECLQSDQNSLVSPGKNPISSVAHSKTQNIGQNDCTAGLAECPPHAESAPMFTDQTKAAVSTNSEQALESKSSVVVKSDPDKKLSIGSPNANTVISLDSSIPDEKLSKDPEIAVSLCDSKINQSNEMSSIDEESNSSELNLKSNVQIYNESQCDINKSHVDISNSSSNDNISHEKGSSSADTDNVNQNPSTSKISNADNILNVEKVKTDSSYVTNVIKEETSDDINKKIFDQLSAPSNNEGAPTTEDTSTLSRDENISNCNDSKTLPINKTANNDSNHDPVKVVIHRIRKDNTDDTWHVPANNKSESSSNINDNNSEKKIEKKLPNVGPQIVILSPATSERKFGFHSSVDENSVITVKEEKEDEENSVAMKKTENNCPENDSIKNEPGSSNSSFRRSPDKKRGRPVGSKNKIKPGNSTKKKKGKRGNKRKKFDGSKLKTPEALPKIKKLKVFNGPYVHIIGSKENPSSISVVNVAQKEEEKISKVPVKRNFNNTVSRIKKKPVGHLSTLSPTYDAFNRDKTWLCIFCHKGSHHSGLGDLYGPYYIKDKNYGNSKSSTPSSSTSSTRTKKRKSDQEENRASKRSKQSAGHSVTESTPVKSSENTSDTDSDLRETWIHEDCAVWCQSISLLGEEVQGLEEAVTDAYENKCCQCSLTGATLGCWGKGCKELYHFSCAKETGCQMDIEKFSLLCPKHQKRSPDRHNRCQ